MTQDSVLVKMASIKNGKSEFISLRFDRTKPESAKMQNYIFYGYDWVSFVVCFLRVLLRVNLLEQIICGCCLFL